MQENCKTCPKCGATKSVSEFYDKGIGRKFAKCKNCHNEEMKLRYAKITKDESEAKAYQLARMYFNQTIELVRERRKVYNLAKQCRNVAIYKLAAYSLALISALLLAKIYIG